MHSRHPRLLRATLRGIAIVQFVLGIAFLAAPEAACEHLGLSPTPPWVGWLLGMMAARCLGYAGGLWLAARDPIASRAWIATMIGIQATDWLVTLKYLALGAVTLQQVTTASFLPVIFVVALLAAWPRAARRAG